jgi:hypothetical protein
MILRLNASIKRRRLERLYRYNAGVPRGVLRGGYSMPLATVPLGTETASAAPQFRDWSQLTNRASQCGCRVALCGVCALRGWKGKSPNKG